MTSILKQLSIDAMPRKEWRAEMYRDNPQELARLDLIYWTRQLNEAEREAKAEGSFLDKLSVLFTRSLPHPEMPPEYYDTPWGYESDDFDENHPDLALSYANTNYANYKYDHAKELRDKVEDARKLLIYAQRRLAGTNYKLLSAPQEMKLLEAPLKRLAAPLKRLPPPKA